MDLSVIGLSHHTAPVDVRERVAFPDGELDGAVRRAAELAGGEAMIVSTCNRVEIYVSGKHGDFKTRFSEFLAVERKFGDGVTNPLESYLYAHDGEAAVRHLFRVASSLDSIVVGEPQILGQVKEAYDTATRVGTVGKMLGQLVPRAFSAAKRVRTETAIARASASVASAAVELGKQIFGDLRSREVLVVGAGEMGELAARHLIAAGCAKLLVINRTFSRGEELAGRLAESGAKTEAHRWEDLGTLLSRADLVLCSTGAPHPVVTRDAVHKAMKVRKGRWLCLLDIAVPRDVEPEAGKLENVYLYDVDALTKLVDDNLADRRREAEVAERIVVDEVLKVHEAFRARGVVPAIRAIREKFLAVAHAEVQRTLGKMHQASDKDRHEVEIMAEAIVNKLLHQPLMVLKRESESEQLVEAVRMLFDLHEITPAAPTDGAHESVMRMSRAAGSDEGNR